jgi:hypothetical protein
VLLAGLVVVSTLGLVGAAYPSNAYNPAEKTVLVTFDVRADFDPGLSDMEARLAKAAFLADVLDEEAVEIRWEDGEPRAMLAHGRQAIQIREDAQALLERVRNGDSTRADERRAAKIAADLRDAERRVAVEEQMNATGTGAANVTELSRIRIVLADATNTTATASGLSSGASPTRPARKTVRTLSTSSRYYPIGGVAGNAWRQRDRSQTRKHS